MRLRNGEVSQEDWCILPLRDPSKRNEQEFADALRLFYDKASVVQYNFDHLKVLNSPIPLINAIHSNSVAASAKPDDAGGLILSFILQLELRSCSLSIYGNKWGYAMEQQEHFRIFCTKKVINPQACLLLSL